MNLFERDSEVGGNVTFRHSMADCLQFTVVLEVATLLVKEFTSVEHGTVTLIALPQLENDVVHSFEITHEITQVCMTYNLHVFGDCMGGVPQFRADKLVREWRELLHEKLEAES